MAFERVGESRGKTWLITLAAAGALASLAQIASARDPEVPVIEHDTALIQGSAFTQPTMPPMRTSNDGRVALGLKRKGPNLAFNLYSPEKIGSPFLESPAGHDILASVPHFTVAASSFHNSTLSGNVVHSALCDGTLEFPSPGAATNPYPCATPGRDCYDLTVITSVLAGPTGPSEFWGTPITVEVANPKTAAASIVSISAGLPVQGAVLPFRAFFEPMVTEDGQLLVGRASLSPVPGYSGTYDIVYSVMAPGDPACDVREWDTFHPITHAYSDPLMQGRYGFAEYPLRDSQGAPIPADEDLHATYPWMDRKGNNLFMTTIASTLFYEDTVQGGIKTRYGASCVTGLSCQVPTTTFCGFPNDPACIPTYDEPSATRGVAVAGLWTHGKVVLLDGMLNHTDFGLRVPEDTHRMVTLYQPGTGPTGTEPGDIQVGSGRDNRPPGQPPGANDNTTFIDSAENLFNAKPNLFPLTPRDVTWLVNTGHVSDELAFDDYLDPNALIVAPMNAALSWGGAAAWWRMQHHDGFGMAAAAQQGSGFDGEIRLQNAATALAADWVIPAYGSVFGTVRVEPVANGGIHGRGLWLDGASGLSWTIPNQRARVDTTPWFVGLFLDSRFPDDDQRRRVMEFPDGTSLQLVGRHRIVYLAADGTTVHADLSLPTSLQVPVRDWMHLGLVIEDAGATVRLYLDGFLFNRWRAAGAERLFRIDRGTLTIGAEPGPAGQAGIRGWIDELKVIASDPNPEVICNHARGTLIQKPRATWTDAVSPYPKTSHLELATALPAPWFGAQFACFHDYGRKQPGAHLRNLPTGSRSLREDLLFPEGPLEFGQPRPDSSANAFCLSCHVPQHPPSLSPDALVPRAIRMEDDPRRQPSQPPRLIFGNIPAGYYPNGEPTTPMVAPPGGSKQDQWVFP